MRNVDDSGWTLLRISAVRFTWATTAVITIAGCTTFSPQMLSRTHRNARGGLSKAGAVAQTEAGTKNSAVPQSVASVRQVSYEQSAVPNDESQTAIQDPTLCPLPADSSVAPLSGVSACQCNNCMSGNCSHGCGTCEPAVASYPIDPQEYLFDGGDQQPAVIVRSDQSVTGLEPEDTVVHYELLDGRTCIAATNRVPIYAPRFGAIRKVTGLLSAERSVGAQPVTKPLSPLAFAEKGLAQSVAMPVAPKGEQSVKLIDALRDRNRTVPAESSAPALPLSDAVSALVDLNFFRSGRMEHAEAAVLARLLANARAWSVPESLEVMIDGKQAVQIVDSKGAQEVYVYDSQSGKCSMRIVKAASDTSANPGDIIQFTIRFDNVGPHTVRNAVIMDSLSARLEYIDGSQQSSVETKFTTEENQVGSTMLKWEVKAPIAKHDGGTIHFRCRVR